MSSEHRRYLLVEQAIGALVFNFVLNGVIAWLLFRHLETVPLWGQQSIAGDTIATAIILPLLTCLIVTRIAHGHVRAGRIPPLRWRHAALGWLPRHAFTRGLALAGLALALFAPVTIAGLEAAGVADLRLWPFVLFKASFAAGAAAIVAPVVALLALLDGAR